VLVLPEAFMNVRNTDARRILVFFVLFLAFAQFQQNSKGVVTSDGNGTHIATPGVAMFGIDHDGVVEILRNGNFSCSGALLQGGFHVLTAGHCVNSEDIANMAVRFYLPNGSVDIAAEWWTPHPEFPGISGTDVGIITLAERAPPEIPRYNPLRSVGMEIDVPNVVFGYGQTGYGLTGKEPRDGNKRGGHNMYEATGATQNINLSTVGGRDAERWLFSDFDNGITANDAFGFHFDKANLGFGPDEVYASSGDSGAPIFVNNGYSHVIAGTVSGGARFSGTPNADVDDTVNGTWGQFSRDARVAEAGNLAFIESFISAVVEPQPLAIVSSTGGLTVEMSGPVGQPIYIRVSVDLVNWEQAAVHRMTRATELFEVFSASEMQILQQTFVVAVREPVTPPDAPDPPEPPVSNPPEEGLFGADANSGQLLGISPLTGAGGTYGATGVADLSGLALDVKSGILYGIDSTTDSLAIINTTTGASSFVGALGVSFSNVSGLAYDPDSKVLYATSSGIAANLYTVNIATGLASLVGPLGVNMPGLAYVPETLTLYGASGQTNSLYTINTVTGAVTLVGDLGINTQWCGLAYDAALEKPVVGSRLAALNGESCVGEAPDVVMERLRNASRPLELEFWSRGAKAAS